MVISFVCNYIKLFMRRWSSDCLDGNQTSPLLRYTVQWVCTAPVSIALAKCWTSLSRLYVAKKEHYTNSKKFLSEMDVDSSPFTTCRFFRNWYSCYVPPLLPGLLVSYLYERVLRVLGLVCIRQLTEWSYHIVTSYHIVVLKRQNRLKVGKDKPKLKVSW